MEQQCNQQLVDDRARDWFMLCDERALTELEQVEFDEWLAANDAHQKSYDQLQTICDGLAELAAGEEGERLRQDNGFGVVSLFTQTGFKNAWSVLTDQIHAMQVSMPRYGVALAVVLSIGLCFSQFTRQTAQSPVLFKSDIAQIRELILEDGSQVTLGAESLIEVSFDGDRREIILTKGQVFFSVAKDASRPFYVSTPSATIRVVGTRFDVRRDRNDVKISVEEGIVDVVHGTQLALSVTREGSDTEELSEQVRLVAGQQLRVSTDGASHVENVELDELASWRSGRLVYRNARLSEVVADVNRYRDGSITLGAPHLESLRVTTSFSVDQVDTMISMLEQSLPVKIYREAGNRIIVLPKTTPQAGL